MISLWAKQWLVMFNPIKTEAVLFTTFNLQNTPILTFDDTVLTFVGLTLSSDCKWHAHIENILFSAAKILGVLRNLKYKVERKAINQIFVSF